MEAEGPLCRLCPWIWQSPVHQAQYGWGTPTDFIVSTGVNGRDCLAKAIEEDEGQKPDWKTHPLLNPEQTFNEFILLYAGLPDGSTITTATINLLPTSRGSIKITSADVKDAPLVDPNYQQLWTIL